MTHEPTWKVLLIGDNSGVGKTIAAMEVARRYGAACSLVDDFLYEVSDGIATFVFDRPKVWLTP